MTLRKAAQRLLDAQGDGWVQGNNHLQAWVAKELNTAMKQLHKALADLAKQYNTTPPRP